MKPKKHIFRIILFISGIVVFFSCNNKKTFECDCNTSGKGGRNYSIGTTTYSDATGKCNAMKQQYAWDTCLTVEAL